MFNMPFSSDLGAISSFQWGITCPHISSISKVNSGLRNFLLPGTKVVEIGQAEEGERTSEEWRHWPARHWQSSQPVTTATAYLYLWMWFSYDIVMPTRCSHVVFWALNYKLLYRIVTPSGHLILSLNVMSFLIRLEQVHSCCIVKLFFFHV